MAQWWESLSALQHFFLYAAIPFSLVLIIQSVITFIGLGGHGADADTDADIDADADVDADSFVDEPDITAAGFRFFTIRGIVAFFCLFGWTGYVLSGTPLATVFVILIATAAGLLGTLLIGLMFYSMRRLQGSGNIHYSNAIGKTAEVYIPIPARRDGRGKVMVTIQERLVEAEAITDDEQKLRTGETVRVVGKTGSTLIVKR